MAFVMFEMCVISQMVNAINLEAEIFRPKTGTNNYTHSPMAWTVKTIDALRIHEAYTWLNSFTIDITNYSNDMAIKQ